jgi:hypothetical protein
MTMRLLHPALTLLFAASLAPVSSWSTQRSPIHRIPSHHRTSSTLFMGYLHGQSSCFMPLKQLDQDYFSPRIIQVAGSFPGITREEILEVSPSEPSPEQGQWAYDFCDPEGPQGGKVAIEGSQIVHAVEDPIVIIAEHTSLNIPLPKELTSVDLIVLVDRAKKRFGERKFLVLYTPDQGVAIGAFDTKADLPPSCEILGQVVMVQIPWLPAMAPTKSGFMEVDEYF